MERKLLFINKNPDIVKEFLDAMKDREIEIDTAENGVDAGLLLKKKEYQVVITGLVMEGYNGEQIVTYVNQTYPNTVCIIYTTVISPAQLQFFMNKRDVFRIFLRPVNFRMEFFQALEEAFEYYTIRMMDQEESSERRKRMEGYQKQVAELEERLEMQRNAKIRLRRYMKKVSAFSMEEYGKNLTPGERKKLERYEMRVADLCCGENGGTKESLAKARQVLEGIKEVIR